MQASLHPEWRKGEGGNLSYINPQCVLPNIYSHQKMTFFSSSRNKTVSLEDSLFILSASSLISNRDKRHHKIFSIDPRDAIKDHRKPRMAVLGLWWSLHSQRAEHALVFPVFWPRPWLQPQPLGRWPGEHTSAHIPGSPPQGLKLWPPRCTGRRSGVLFKSCFINGISLSFNSK